MIFKSDFFRRALMGMIMGDAYIYRTSKTANSLIKIDHSGLQSELIEHKYALFKEEGLVTQEIYIYKDGRPIDATSKSFKSLTLPVFNFFHDNFYRDKQKIVPKWFGKYLSCPIVLAYWYMDDGNSNKKKGNPYNKSICINTHSFTQKEVKFISGFFKQKFGKVTMCHDMYQGKSRGLRIYISNLDYSFSNFIAPYIIDSMRYKLPNIQGQPLMWAPTYKDRNENKEIVRTIF